VVCGGMAQMRADPHAWRPELWMAIAGPITSLLLGGVFILLGGLLSGPLPETTDPAVLLSALSPLATLCFWLGPINVILGLFNLVPGFPLDGGRVLRAALWGATGDMVRATRWASNAGRAFAWLLIATGFAMVLGVRVPLFGTGLAGGLWLALIGWFLNNAAISSYRQLLVTEALAEVPVARLMLADVRTVTPDLSVRALVDDYMMSSDQRAYPVVDGTRLAGMVCLGDVRKVPRAAWDSTRVADIMTAEVATLRPEEPATQALTTLGQRQINQLPVVDGQGRIRGLVRREDVLRWLAVHGDADLRRGTASEI